MILNSLANWSFESLANQLKNNINSVLSSRNAAIKVFSIVLSIPCEITPQ